MNDPIQTIREIDLTAYRAARKMSWDQKKAAREAREDLHAASRKAISALRRRASKIVAPHYIEWHATDGLPVVDHVEWSATPHLSGDIFPLNPGPYTCWARAHIKFSITGKDMKEFDEVFGTLRLAADALAETLFSKGETNE